MMIRFAEVGVRVRRRSEHNGAMAIVRSLEML